MAVFAGTPTTAQLTAVAGQLPALLSRALGPGAVGGGGYQIAETLPVWRWGGEVVPVLTPHSTVGPTEAETAGLKVTTDGQWHHQIVLLGQPVAFARSEPANPPGPAGRLLVRSVHAGTLAELVAAGIAVVNNTANYSDDYKVRLLLAPSHDAEALWLHHDTQGTDDVVVLDGTPALGFRRNAVMPMSDFAGRLQNTRPITGLV